MLLISGPTGSGKTTSFNLICKSLKIDILEWVNPIDSDLDFWQGGQSAKLLDFLEQSKYKSLIDSEENEKKVILIEDFPNFVLRNSHEFHNILE